MKINIDIPELEKNYRIDEDGAIFSLRKNRYLSPFFNSAGYLYVSVEYFGYRMVMGVHRIVAVKYIGQPPVGKETSHKDGDKQNNHWSNMEYLTHAENILKSFREHGRQGVSNHFPRKPFSDETKKLMSNAKKKRVTISIDAIETTYPSIGEASIALQSYPKAIYRCATFGTAFNNKKTRVCNATIQFTDSLI